MLARVKCFLHYTGKDRSFMHNSVCFRDTYRRGSSRNLLTVQICWSSIFPNPSKSCYKRVVSPDLARTFKWTYSEQENVNVLTVGFVITSFSLHVLACLSTWKTVSNPTLGQTTTLYDFVCRQVLRNLPRFPPTSSTVSEQSIASPIGHKSVAYCGSLKFHAPILTNITGGFLRIKMW
jgi:hypothetical protein